ncbi:MAG: DUF58 domain-containing protein [Planctomycetia bacterium]|nr:DUF58 domain-containing protein [Planctomycetia bacterium]
MGSVATADVESPLREACDSIQLDANFFRRCEGFHAVARREWGGRFLGRASRFAAALAGTEVSGETDYATGDDFRYVDWNRAARLDELVSRQFRGQAAGRVTVLIDAGPSMALGSPSKLLLAQQLAAVLGYLALAEGRSVAIACSAADSQRYTGRPQAGTWFDAVEATAVSAEFNLNESTNLLAKTAKPGDLVIVLSDLLMPDGFQEPLGTLRKRGCDLFVVQVLAPQDVEPDWLGGVQLHDVQTAGTLAADLDDEDLKHYREVAAEFCRDMRRYCDRAGLGMVQFRSDMALDTCVAQLIRLAAIPSSVGR